MQCRTWRECPHLPHKVSSPPWAGLTAAGVGEVEVHDRPGWQARERAMWEEAAALDPGEDPALRSLHDEGVRALPTFDLVRRV